MNLSGIVDWVLDRPPQDPKNLVARLTREADEAEKRADSLEEEAKIRKRLALARERCMKAKREMDTKRFRSLTWIMIVVVVVGVFILMLKDCGGA